MVLPHYYARFLGGKININAEYSEYRWVSIEDLDKFEPKIDTVAPIVKSIQKIGQVAAPENYLEL